MQGHQATAVALRFCRTWQGVMSRPVVSPLPSMRVLLVTLLSLAAVVVVLTTGALSSKSFTTHIGSRIPPLGAGCFRAGDVTTDEGTTLGVFKCPI